MLRIHRVLEDGLRFSFVLVRNIGSSGALNSKPVFMQQCHTLVEKPSIGKVFSHTSITRHMHCVSFLSSTNLSYALTAATPLSYAFQKLTAGVEITRCCRETPNHHFHRTRLQPAFLSTYRCEAHITCSSAYEGSCHLVSTPALLEDSPSLMSALRHSSG